MNRRKMGTGVMASVLAVSMMVTPVMAGEQVTQDSASVMIMRHMINRADI